MNGEEDLAVALRRAVMDSCAEIVASHGADSLDGYALCTDDDLGSLFPMAASRSFRDDPTREVDRFVPVDWEFSEGAPAFDAVNRMLSPVDGESDATRHARLEGLFRCVIRVLAELKREGQFDGTRFLWVTSTDPGPAMRQLGQEAARELNASDEFDGWRKVMEF